MEWNNGDRRRGLRPAVSTVTITLPVGTQPEARWLGQIPAPGWVCVRPIRTDADYEAAKGEISRLGSAKEGTDDYDRLEVLMALVNVYQGDHLQVAVDTSWIAEAMERV